MTRNKHSTKSLILFCNKLFMLQRNLVCLLSLVIVLTLILSILILFNPAKLSFINLTESYKNEKKLKELNDAKDLYHRAVINGDRGAEKLKTAGMSVFLDNGNIMDSNDGVSIYSDEDSMEETPKLEIKAIIKNSKGYAAYIDIHGIAEGVLVMPGMNFLMYGKIISIGDKTIEWKWKDKIYTTKF